MAYEFQPSQYKDQLLNIVNRLATHVELDAKHLQRALQAFNKESGKLFNKSELVRGIDWLIEQKLVDHIHSDRLAEIKDLVRMKPMRTRSGVAIVTVLTKPFPCPGKCIFCPNDVRMPKSYLRDEPGAQRAERNAFDPYLQVYNRLQALKNNGHPTGKVELIVLGGTWSYYPEAYQIWFVKRCFQALNDFGQADHRTEIKVDNIFVDADKKYDVLKTSGKRKTYNELIAEIEHTEIGQLHRNPPNQRATWDELWEQHAINSTATTRCVGLVIETRPDDINIAEVQRIRKLGCTKVQIGIQTLHDDINDANKRGHHAVHVEMACKLLRSAGFKVHAHLMPNLYLATPETDLDDFQQLFGDVKYRPDELKIYPTSVIKNTELYDLWQQGKYQPYDHETLVNLIAEMIVATPPYCRLTRVIRDIPGSDIVAGNMQTNLREVVQARLRSQGRASQDIRWREIGDRMVTMPELQLDTYEYDTSDSKELFLSYVTKDDNQIAAFLRLSLPQATQNEIFDELSGSAIIREVHVYGQMMNVGLKEAGMAQHLGLGTKLIAEAKRVTKDSGYDKLAVISAIGTREYYAKRGFELQQYYQVCSL